MFQISVICVFNIVYQIILSCAILMESLMKKKIFLVYAAMLISIHFSLSVRYHGK